MNDSIKGFESYLADQKHKSISTVQSYCRDISRFHDFLDLKGYGLKNVTPETVRDFLERGRMAGKSEATITRNLASIRSYYQYLILGGIAKSNPTVGVKTKKTEKKLPNILTSEEIDKLLLLPDSSDIKGCRDRAMLELLYATGIRVSELIAINLEDIDFRKSILYCSSVKNERNIPVYPSAMAAISDYLNRARVAIAPYESEPALFLNMNGQRMTRQGLWKIVKSYTEISSPGKDISPHTLRHSFAAHLLENGARLKDIQDMMGHADISSTKIYSKVVRDRMTDVYASFHPRAGK